MSGGEASDFLRRQQVHFARVFDVTAIGGEGGAQGFFAHLAGLKPEREGEFAGGFRDVALHFDLGQLGRVLFEVIGELGVIGIAQRAKVGGEKV